MIRTSGFCVLISLFFFLLGCTEEPTETVISLAGAWTVKLDAQGQGAAANWAAAKLGGQAIDLPGTLDEAAIGTKDTLGPGINNYVLSGLRRKHEYLGPAWYQREIDVPESFDGKQVELELERVLWKSELYVDGQRIGTANSLIAPHRYDLTGQLSPGKHTITLMIDNSNQYPFINVLGDKYPDPSYKEMAHAYTNHTQIKWNGVLGKLELRATTPTTPQDVDTYYDAATESVEVRFAQRGEAAPAALNYTISLPTGAPLGEGTLSEFTRRGDRWAADLPLPPSVELWDEFNPNVYQLSLRSGDGPAVTEPLALRTVSHQEEQLLLNGRRIFLRGNLECSIFPLTGHPPLDRAGWDELIAQAKNYGLNHLRFHSWCPPQAAFAAADEAGFYLQVELPHWSLKVGEDAATTEWLRAEGQRLLAEYGNHPSFIFMALGNELQGDAALLNEMVRELKATDDRRLYATTAFSFQSPMGTRPEPEDDFFIAQWTEKGWIRGQGVFNDYAPAFNRDYVANSDFVKIPLVTHEIGQYSVYPAISEIEKYTGVLRPLNFISVKQELEAKGMLDDAADFTNASGKLAAMLYKEEIESVLKTPNLSGFQLLQLQDFPGQGTALVGLLDAFWESKGIISGEEFRRFNSELVPLVRFGKPVYTSGETFTASIEVANYFEPLDNATIDWTISDRSGATVEQGTLSNVQLAIGSNQKLGDITWPVTTDKARELTLEVSLRSTPYANDWKLWVYPERVELATTDILVTSSFVQAQQALAAGRKVLLSPKPEEINGVPGRFVPVFWSPVHFPDQPGTMGLLIDEEHPALADFPTRSHTEWQWWDLCHNSRSVILDELDASPIVRVIDNFVTNHQLANVFEAKVGNGQLVFASTDLINDLDNRPVARQLRSSLLQYMNGGDFTPVGTLTAAELGGLRK